MRRIGIVGGTFDPIHFGHLMLGRQAVNEYNLDEIWYMPSRQPPHKKDHKVTLAADRMAMVQLAIDGIPHFKFSDFELNRTGGNTYTADTLCLLNELYPDTEFFFIVGADSIFDIEKWYRPDIVLKAATFLAAKRNCNGTDHTLEDKIRLLEKKYDARIFCLHSQEVDLSSEEIRKKIMLRQSVTTLIPKAVENYIDAHHLYLNEVENE